MVFMRFCRVIEERPASLVPESGGVASRAQSLFSLPDGSFLMRCEFASAEALVQAQALPNVKVLPSLGTNANKLPQVVKDWLAVYGVTVASDDTILDVVRQLRNNRGQSFDISERE